MEQMTLSKLARDVAWNCIVDVKDFDAEQASIVRVFEHTSGFGYVFAQHSVGKVIDGTALDAITGSPHDAVAAAGAKAKVSVKALADALVAL